MGRLGTKSIVTASPTAEVEQPHSPTQIPSLTTISSVTSSDQQENDAPDSISPVQVNPPCNEVPPHGNQEPPYCLQEDKDNKLENIEAVTFPPRPSVTVAAPPQDPDKEIVVYVPPGGNTMPPSAGRPSNDQEPVMFPPQKTANPIYGQGNDVAGQNMSIVSNVGSQRQPQNQNGLAMPPVILVPFVGVPWQSGLFDCCQQPTNGTHSKSDFISLYQ